MHHTHPSRVHRVLALAVTLLIMFSGAAQAQGDRPARPSAAPSISPEALKEAVSALRAQKAAAVGPEGKLDTALRHAHAASLSGATPGPSWTPLATAEGAVQVEIVTEPAWAERAQEAVHHVGGRVTGVGYEGARVQAWVPVAALGALAKDPAVQRVRRPATLETGMVSASALAAGAWSSEGLAAMNAAAWHAANYRGDGVRVGIIDGGFQGYASLLGSDLPAQVTVRNFVDLETDADVNGQGSNHGTACAEVIHDVAPGAALYLAKITTSVDLEEAVNWLKAQQVDVISMSGGWSGTTPGDGTGHQASVVQAAHDAGILWVNAAGNERLTHWGGPYRDADGDGFHEFDPAGIEFNHLTWTDGSAILLESGQLIRAALRWDDWNAPTQDYDLYLARDDGYTLSIVAASNDYQAGEAGQQPIEFVAALTTGGPAFYGLVIDRFNGDRAANLDLFVPDAPRLYASVAARSLCTPADAAATMAVAAVHSASPFRQEAYSSEGPTNGPGGALSGGMEKPAIAGYANVATVTYGSCNAGYCFNGTSSATPHVAGAAALVAGAIPSLSPDQLRHYLQSRAVDLGSPGYDAQSGYGRVYLGAPPVLHRVALPLLRRG